MSALQYNCISEKKSIVIQHIETVKHRDELQKQESGTHRRQQSIAVAMTEQTRKDPFSEELCHALLSAGIPLKK